MTVFGVMKGAVAATAAYVFLQIIAGDDPFAEKFKAVALWIIAFIGMTMTYQANSLGTVLMFWTPTWRDVVPSFGVGVLEFCLFALLRPESISVQSSFNHTAWFATFAFYALVGGSLAGYAATQVQKVAYENNVEKILLLYSTSQRKNYIFAMTVFVFWGVVVILLVTVNIPNLIVDWVLIPIAALNMAMALRWQERDLKSIAEQIDFSKQMSQPNSEREDKVPSG